MRTIKVKPGLNEYTLKSDDGTFIGELTIRFDKKARTCDIDVTRRGATITSLSIQRRI